MTLQLYGILRVTCAVRTALGNCFALSDVATTSHPFVIACVLDPATKSCVRFPGTVRQAAYTHVRQLTEAVAAQLDPATDDEDSRPSDVAITPPCKRLKKDDSRKVSHRNIGLGIEHVNSRPISDLHHIGLMHTV